MLLLSVCVTALPMERIFSNGLATRSLAHSSTTFLPVHRGQDLTLILSSMEGPDLICVWTPSLTFTHLAESGRPCGEERLATALLHVYAK